ncbi:MAG: hypothetical protein CMH30_02180 [Micavibrio sp.]|nr:hypothetical protein [Micavibrio sp.]|tara:strand:+ start:2970 stop:3785 length:816 start_codon:yes stop_codon:yes gene_type:complete
MKYLLIAFLLIFSCSVQAEEKALERVLSKGEIRCGYGISPPVLVVDPNTGEISGLDYDVWQEIGKELDVRIIWAEEAGWGVYNEGLKAGRYDAFCSQVWPNPTRLKHSSLAGPVVSNALKAYVRKDDTRFDGNLERINQSDIKIPAVDGDVSVTMAKNRFPNAQILALPEMATVADLFMSVITKKADVMFLDESFYQELSKVHGDVLRPAKDTAPVFVYGGYYSFKQGEYQLRDMVNIALKRIIDDGRLENIALRYSNKYLLPTKSYEVQK